MSKILLIGSRNNKFDKNHTGGVSILFELLIYELMKRKIDFTIIDTLKANNGNGVKTFFNTVYQMTKHASRHDYIALQASPNSFLYLAPIAILISKLFRKPLSIRVFAGNFFEKYKNYGFLKKFIVRFALKNTDDLFFELKSLVDEAKKYNQNTYWFPNVRDDSIQKFSKRTFRKRFVYIGSINQEKGIDELCEVIQNLNDDIICDLYGPLKFKNEKYSESYFKEMNISYKGPLKEEDVLKTMNQYDVLVLPSHREGYPGVIIEAFSQGLPVIATKLLGILEMCTHEVNAILIDVKSPQQLLEAMLSMNEESYLSLHEGAKKAFSNFSSSTRTDFFLEKIGYLESIS
jgi:glycosyltransferase involved in cell wall biosynthesis